MNPELLNKLQESATKVLDFVDSTGESTVDFAKEQVPLVVQDVLRWGMISNGIDASVYMFLLILMFVYMKKTSSKIWAQQKKDNVNPWLLLYLTYIPTIQFFCMFVSYLSCLCKISFAPRLYLIEQLQILVKQ